MQIPFQCNVASIIKSSAADVGNMFTRQFCRNLPHCYDGFIEYKKINGIHILSVTPIATDNCKRHHAGEENI